MTEPSDSDELLAALRILGDCWCGQPAVGDAPTVEVPGGYVLAHDCHECPEHCQAVADTRRCEFGLCRRAATTEVDNTDEGLTQVCDQHVMPAIRWGVAHPDRRTTVRALAGRVVA